MQALGIVMVIVGLVLLVWWVMSLVRAVRQAEVRAELASATASDYAQKYARAIENEQAAVNELRETLREVDACNARARELVARVEELERRVAA